MKPGGGGQPKNQLRDMINSSFGSYEAFRDHFHNTGLATFGSGWVWLVFDRQKNSLRVLQSKDGDTPVAGDNFIPILTMVSA
jgi:Fe-Mn family superoxide dismutase